MDFRQRYENLLQILCDAYTKMYQLLDGVEQCDRELNRLSLINRPSVEEVCGVTDCKDRLIVTIDKISIAIEPIHQQLSGGQHSSAVPPYAESGICDLLCYPKDYQ